MLSLPLLLRWEFLAIVLPSPGLHPVLVGSLQGQPFSASVLEEAACGCGCRHPVPQAQVTQSCVSILDPLLDFKPGEHKGHLLPIPDG